MPDAYVAEALERDVPALDPNISDVDLDDHIRGLALRLMKLAAEIVSGPRGFDQLVDLDSVYDALDAAYRLEDARRVPPAAPDTAE